MANFEFTDKQAANPPAETISIGGSSSPSAAVRFKPGLVWGDPAHAAIRVLVVDDDPLEREVIVRVLEFAGYAVDSAEDGAAGWRAVRAGSFQLVVTDIWMPRLTGVEMIHRLRASHSNLPCLIVSGELPWFESDMPRDLLPGASLAKPFAASDLLLKVKTVLLAAAAANPRPLQSELVRSEPGTGTAGPT